MALDYTLIFMFLLIAPLAEIAVRAAGELDPHGPDFIRIEGTLYCTGDDDDSVGVNGTAATPVYPNASVQLECEEIGVVSDNTTDVNGVFSIVLEIYTSRLLPSTVIDTCKLVVPPCNSDLLGTTGKKFASGLLYVGISGQYAKSTILAPSGFS